MNEYENREEEEIGEDESTSTNKSCLNTTSYYDNKQYFPRHFILIWTLIIISAIPTKNYQLQVSVVFLVCLQTRGNLMTE
ncbi:unnamed protein product [Rhizophagus irregularis]|nr:unnamed protein product [Rhizophagus irregularis]